MAGTCWLVSLPLVLAHCNTFSKPSRRLLMSSQAAPQAAPAQGAAPTATEQRTRQVLALLDQCQARDQAAQRRSSYLVPASSTHDEPATDPARWEGFI